MRPPDDDQPSSPSGCRLRVVHGHEPDDRRHGHDRRFGETTRPGRMSSSTCCSSSRVATPLTNRWRILAVGSAVNRSVSAGKIANTPQRPGRDGSSGVEHHDVGERPGSQRSFARGDERDKVSGQPFASSPRRCLGSGCHVDRPAVTSATVTARRAAVRPRRRLLDHRIDDLVGRAPPVWNSRAGSAARFPPPARLGQTPVPWIAP